MSNAENFLSTALPLEIHVYIKKEEKGKKENTSLCCQQKKNLYACEKSKVIYD
jgi:hypothetical protein